MGLMTIHNLDGELGARLRIEAAKQGRSMGEKACHIFRDALDVEEGRGLA